MLYYTLNILTADINECATNRDDCGVNSDCFNTPGSFQCNCKTGFQEDDGTCIGKH